MIVRPIVAYEAIVWTESTSLKAAQIELKLAVFSIIGAMKTLSTGLSGDTTHRVNSRLPAAEFQVP